MKIIRWIFTIVLAGAFLFLAYMLYDRQENQYTFLSFQLEEPSKSLFVTDIDRLLSKINQVNEMREISMQSDLVAGFGKLLSVKDTFNTKFGKACFLSFNEKEFVITLHKFDLKLVNLPLLITSIFGLEASYSEGILSIGDENFVAKRYGTYTVISSHSIKPSFNHAQIFNSNADYLIPTDSNSLERYILADNKNFKVWKENVGPIRGKPVKHQTFIRKIPASFNAVYFYGSERFAEDKSTFFNVPEEEAFSWMDNGLVVFKKDAYELLLAPQSEQRDLKKILEEQTLRVNADSMLIQYLNVKNHEIMPFETHFNWTESIPELTEKPRFYTEFENFNILANSLEAMNWYLSEIQTASLIENDKMVMQHYESSIPFKVNKISMEHKDGRFSFSSATWLAKMNCIKTKTSFNIDDSLVIPQKESTSFSTSFDVKRILPYQQNNEINLLLVGEKKLALHSKEGVQKWEIALPSPTVMKPQLVDLENDGVFEIALYLKNEFRIINFSGKTVNGLSKKVNETIKGGLCANYDNGYNYRFFVVTENNVMCLNENGELVTGWTFTKPSVGLTGETAYCQIGGIDYITFKAVNDRLFVLNRKGENKFGTESASKLPNESFFVTGKKETALHKLGYANQYIYNRYLEDSYTDSIKLDIRVNPVKAEWIMLEKSSLMIEEPTRVLLFDEFGYLKQEILKPQGANEFLGIESLPEIYYVFYNKSNNTLYLLNEGGKISLSNLQNSTRTYGIILNYIYTYSAQTITEYKLN